MFIWGDPAGIGAATLSLRLSGRHELRKHARHRPGFPAAARWFARCHFLAGAERSVSRQFDLNAFPREPATNLSQ
jgi:hypothetical protein